MRKTVIFCFMALFIILTGCTSEEEKKEADLQRSLHAVQSKHKEIETIINQTELYNYIDGTIQFKDENYSGKINTDIDVPINDSYLALEHLEQYRLLEELAQEIFDFQGNGFYLGNIAISEIEYKTLTLTFGDDGDNYIISLENEAPVLTTDNVDNLDNQIFGKIAGEEFVINKSGTVLKEGEYERIGFAAYIKETDTEEKKSSTDSVNSQWNSLSASEKYNIVSRELQTLMNQGYSVYTTKDYFVDALDAFYEGGQTDFTSIPEAIQMVGFSGGAISK
ncbi:hypothetical protein D8M04_17795 [Oceanobacillus piezotolerans]|uniref:Uncharacterized protein n=1 Tax=Oceanobacillus piezotolerans TaxID=2448030 RepID=A0A498D2J0_9BACI|nr:hypothetical protein [Oceanobacillus piezotolerans]RLL41098.1 hypothetical protein D8M04_17795 [Oceanobacillus piezotolerans]